MGRPRIEAHGPAARSSAREPLERAGPMDRRRGRWREGAGRLPLWVTAATVGLLALGFRRGSRFAGPGPTKRDPTGQLANDMDPARGRFADTPSEIPARGWKDILLRVWQNISRHRILAIAAGIAYYELLAIFPAIAAFVSIYGLFSDPASVGTMLDHVSGFLPGGAVQVIRDQITYIASQAHGRLGLTFVISLAISLWSANAGMKALFDALNIVYEETEKRSFLKLNAITLACTLGTMVFLLFSVALVTVLPVALQYVGLQEVTKLLVDILRWPILLLIVSLALALLYRYGPSRRTAQWRWISWGSAFAAIAWLAASMLFSWYATNFGSYNRTFGSLGAVAGFMTWLWLSAIVVLIGAELDAEMEHQTARDTTTGHPKPMGRRGARMADTVGPAQDKAAP
jgi:membrane protein